MSNITIYLSIYLSHIWISIISYLSIIFIRHIISIYLSIYLSFISIHLSYLSIYHIYTNLTIQSQLTASAKNPEPAKSTRANLHDVSDDTEDDYGCDFADDDEWWRWYLLFMIMMISRMDGWIDRWIMMIEYDDDNNNNDWVW